MAVEAARLGVWHCDFPFEKIRFSTAISRSFGLPPSGEITREMLYSFIHPLDRPWVKRAFERCIDGGEDYEVEHRVVNALNGAVRWIRAVGRCYHDREGGPHHFDGIIWDITRKKEEQEHLRLKENELRLAMEKELAEALQLRERMLGIVSHDLKTPLSTIAMSANALREQVVGEPALKNVDRVLRNVERMRRLINELLDFARIRACGGVLVEAGPVDLHALCRHAVDEFAVAHPRWDIHLAMSGNGLGMWDGDRLTEVLSNLLCNAVQHGGGRSIRVDVHDKGGEVTLAVHNQGPPIPHKILPFIFDPYRQGEGRGESDARSVGLGLYIVQQIVLAHRGHIDAKSPDGDGTTFTVRLPRRLYDS
jgi:PAS domain S-box-containing protein